MYCKTYLQLNMKRTVQYLHWIALAIYSVLRTWDRGAITPVQMELQCVVGCR